MADDGTDETPPLPPDVQAALDRLSRVVARALLRVEENRQNRRGQKATQPTDDDRKEDG